MKELTFFIVEDDPGVEKILSRVIEGNMLGTVVGRASDGRQAVTGIQALRPDVVLLDFLLPEMDGLAILSQTRNSCQNVIMISEVADKEMVAKAYQAGIEFYIHKPVNIIEVMSVIKRISDTLTLKSAVESLDQAFSKIRKGPAASPQDQGANQYRSRLRYILAQLGIQGDSGSREIEEAVLWLVSQQRIPGAGQYRLSDLYAMLCRLEGRDCTTPGNAALEQRMRRTVSKALTNLAFMGLDDYGNEIFSQYAPILFDFAEVRQQMSHLKGNSQIGGKINIKKFIEGLATELQHSQI